MQNLDILLTFPGQPFCGTMSYLIKPASLHSCGVGVVRAGGLQGLDPAVLLSSLCLRLLACCLGPLDVCHLAHHGAQGIPAGPHLTASMLRRSVQLSNPINRMRLPATWGLSLCN